MLKESLPEAAESPLMDRCEVATFYHVSTVTVDRWVKRGLLAPVELPFATRRVLFARRDVEAVLAGVEK